MNNRIFTVPNILTFIRIGMIPLTVILIARDDMIRALIVFLAACGTDLLDGWIARKYNAVSKLGIWLDPLADKLMAASVLVAFTFVPAKIIPLFISIAVIAKELLLLSGGLIMLKKGLSAPSDKFGKIAALLLNTSIASGFLYKQWAPYYLYAIYFALALTLGALVHYAIKNGHLVFKKQGEN